MKKNTESQPGYIINTFSPEEIELLRRVDAFTVLTNGLLNTGRIVYEAKRTPGPYLQRKLEESCAKAGIKIE